MEFSWQGYWSGLSFSSPGDLPNLRIKPLQADFLSLSHLGSPIGGTGIKQISRDLAKVEGIRKETEKMMIVERIALKLPNGNISDKIYPSFHSEGCRAVN